MTPQAQTILTHLANHGPITGVEAEAVYRVRHLPRRIADLRDMGFGITSSIHRDATGQRYARYTLTGVI